MARESRLSERVDRPTIAPDLSAGQLVDLAERLAAFGPDVASSNIPDASRYLCLTISALQEEAGRRAIRELQGS